ncbi:hypothetical protein MMC14_001071 [Varicellaria rhodocarpa]|nr:hypothetical protein [Varicellaria rhodocarpa]
MAIPSSTLTPQPTSPATHSLHDIPSPPRTASTKWPLPTNHEVPAPSTTNRQSRFFPVEKSTTTTSQESADLTLSFNIAMTRFSDALNRSRRGTAAGDIPIDDSHVPTHTHGPLPPVDGTSAGKRVAVGLHAGVAPLPAKKEDVPPFARPREQKVFGKVRMVAQAA